MTTMRWRDGHIQLTHSEQTNDPMTGDLHEEVFGEITAPPEWWLEAVVHIIAMLPGKPNADNTGYVLGPANSDPDMIGTLIATKLKEFS
ncbi:hypothetical protein I6N91_03190 [Arthrobacter sp. MSA 4-2]|uniref:hypothetical protein n=1 Tax=Arthrobacter sp. MSA 4-2 TaxID=2794349 RepID=UPI0018E6F598|nr:hypothetical protein [Arthrobacter sp. MSA 4-2]MBJ2119979.1 hypothetical protein [Arthrobacter sp. MSA 4-2]